MNEELERIAKDVVDASMKLHMALGPGLLESVYTVILQKKMQERGYRVEREVPIPVEYLNLGQHLVLPKDTPLCNVWLTMLQGLGINALRHGDSTGVVKELQA